MNSHQLIFTVILSLIAWIFSPSILAKPASEQEKQLEHIKGKISSLSSAINLDQKTRKELLLKLASSERQIGSLGRFIHKLQIKIDRLDNELIELALQKKQRQDLLEKQRQQLRSLVLSAYAIGRQERLKLFLNQQDPVVLNRIMTYYDYFNRERIRHIQLAQSLISQIKQNETDIKDSKLALDATYADKNDQLKSMQQAKQSRAKLVAKLNADINSKTRSLAQLREDAQALTQLLADIQRQQLIQLQNKQQKFSTLRGKLSWPTKGFLSKFFGSDKVGGVKWDGVFITSPEGREVRTVHHGKVAYADWLRGYGLLTIIDHGDGYMTLYGHNQSLFKEIGDWVDSGDTIALTGNSGGVKIPGLYFSIRKDGKPTNPKKWCKKMKGRNL